MTFKEIAPEVYVLAVEKVIKTTAPLVNTKLSIVDVFAAVAAVVLDVPYQVLAPLDGATDPADTLVIYL